MRLFPTLGLALALACAVPSDPTQPQPRRLPPDLPLGAYGTLVLGQPPQGPLIHRMLAHEWPPYLYFRQPVYGVWTTTPDSLKGAWASLDSDGNVRCFLAEFGHSFGFDTVRGLLVDRLGPPTLDSTDQMGNYSIWVDAYSEWMVGAGRGSTTSGGALVAAFLRAGGPAPRDPEFIGPCAPYPS
jgi:hypothetical protein